MFLCEQEPVTVTVATAAIGGNYDFGGAIIVVNAFAIPPFCMEKIENQLEKQEFQSGILENVKILKRKHGNYP